MRLLRSELNPEQQRRSEIFAKWLLDVGNGKIGEPDEEGDQDSCWITIPPEYYVSSDAAGMSDLIDFIYDDNTLKTPTIGALQEKQSCVQKTTLQMWSMLKFYRLLKVKEQFTYFLISSVKRPGHIFKPWKNISLGFGKITAFEALQGKEPEFPEHHFEFRTYNQLAIKSSLPRRKLKNGVSDADKSRLPKKSRHRKSRWKHCRIHDVGRTCKAVNKEKITPPIIIAISSCRVIKYKDVQLSTTSATHYYINLRTPEAEYAYTAFKQKYSLNPPLQVTKYCYEDPEQEKIRNKQTLSTLLQQHPAIFKGIRFTCESTITSVAKNRDWNYSSCSQCSKKINRAKGQLHLRRPWKTGPTDIQVFQIQFTPNTPKEAGEFTVVDVLDIQSAIKTKNIGTSATTKESTKKDKSILDVQLSTTSATHYYINLRTPEAEYAYTAEYVLHVNPQSHLLQKIETGTTHYVANAVFQIQFTPNTPKEAGEFTVVDVLDIQSAIETKNIGTSATTKESTKKDKSIPGTPPEDIVEQIAQIVVSTIPNQKSETEIKKGRYQHRNNSITETNFRETGSPCGTIIKREKKKRE
ncbi:hypothetical protein Tco_0371914 [Tanacetum coccineum]